nr:L-rhamnose-binding lectin CSL3-like [Danio rerio]|eukprot:XP_021325762.1 L-rhamnose-binding lectin CSL3-like [Danio rerio]
MSDLGFVKVLEANFGRTDRTTCISGRPANQINNVHCFRESSLSTMSARLPLPVCSCFRCDGIKSCSVPAVNSVFSDPCFGTHKFLDITYDCIPSSKRVVLHTISTVNLTESTFPPFLYIQ